MFESSNRVILLCKSDYEKLTKLVDKGHGKSHPKLSTAVVVDDHMLPEDMARIGAKVSLKDLGTGSVAKFLLCANTGKRRESDDGVRPVSIASSLGIALLGTRMGEHIKWTLPNGHTRYLRISEVAADAEVY